MVKKLSPRHGSLQFWPRKRSKNKIARVRHWTILKDVKPLGFMGYKVGMVHIMGAEEAGKKTINYSFPATVVECPPIKIFSIRFYNKKQLKTEILSQKIDSNVNRALIIPKKYSKSLDDVKIDYDEIRLLVYTQPKLTSIGKKKSDIFELPLGGNKDDQINWLKENMDKEISIFDVFKENSMLDIHSITKGKGFQGVIKRFGARLKAKKSEKGQREVGARSGGWNAQAHMMWRVPQPGKMGYHTRTEYNKVVYKISDDLNEINPKSGFKGYGFVKNAYILLKGSIPGPSKRAIKLSFPRRPNNKLLNTKIKLGKVIL